MPVSRRRGSPSVTFLQYVAERLMGPPDRRTATYGESYWCCPFHHDTRPSFHTMPSRPEFPKDRWWCFGCHLAGDVFDLLRRARDILHHRDVLGNFEFHKALLERWRQDYEREATPAAAELIFPGRRRLTAHQPDAREEEHMLKLAENALSDLTAGECDVLMLLKDKVGDEVSLDFLARACRRMRECFTRMDAEHLAECRDSECDARVCITARASANGKVR